MNISFFYLVKLMCFYLHETLFILIYEQIIFYFQDNNRFVINNNR